MSYHRFNNLAELLNGDLTAKIGRGIFSKDLMDRECNCYLPSKVNSNVSTNHILNFPPWISHMKPWWRWTGGSTEETDQGGRTLSACSTWLYALRSPVMISGRLLPWSRSVWQMTDHHGWSTTRSWWDGWLGWKNRPESAQSGLGRPGITVLQSASLRC